MSYLQTIKADAIKVWHSHRILPSICGAQASLESGSGTSKLSKPPYNNHFGIKAGTDWTGRTVSMLTGEHVNGGRIEIYADFRAYDSIYDSIADYAAFFTSTPWRKENYKHVVGETDYKKAANALRAAGYATDPQYPTKLIRIIENNNLQSWDREALASSAGSAPSTQTTATKYDSSKSSNATAINTSGWNQAEVDQFLMNAVDPPYINGAYINRFLTAYYPDSPLIGEGDTIKTMADYYGISVGAAMGVWAKETTFGREHPGLVDHNYGCIKWTSGSVYPSVTYDGTQWNKYPSKKVGIAAWFHLLRYNYIELGYHRYDSFLNRYSPTGDGNVHATFKNIMWGALKSFGYDTSETSTKYNHSKPSDNPSTVKPPASIGSGGTVVDATSKPINKRVGGQFTDAVAAYVKTNGATWIGDSLLVGTEPFAKKYSPVSNFDGLGSRQISHATPSLNATQVIRNMLNAGTLKDIIIFIIGTNRGVTKAEVDTVMSIIGSNRKIIFVSTASEVNHSAGVQGEYYGASENYSNAFFANWNQEARAKRSVYYTPDGAGGKYIHMTPTGYEAHAKYLLAAFYEVANADHSQDVAVEQKPEFLSIEDYELTEDGIITYYENTKQVTGSDGKVTLMPEKKTYDTGIKGFYSPKDDKFVYNPDANNRWGHAVDAGNPSWIDTIYTNESTNSAIEMIEGAIQELINRSEPASQYTVSLLDVDETLSIGDTGVFIDHNFNPPLYIEARVLSISTSMTDIASNTIVIGNVVELVQKENPAITALKAELQAAREEVKQEMQNSNPIVANIVSTNGLVLGDAYKETQLSIILLQGTKDVTDQFSRFEWERVSSDAASDEAFNRLLEVEKSNTIKVFNRDIKNNQSIFIARAYNESGDAFFQAETKLNYSDTALWTDTDTPPSDAKDGATWVDESGKQWVKKDGEWEERVDQAIVSQVRIEVEGAMAEAEQAKADAIKAYDDAIAEAERLVTESDAVWQGKMEDYDEQVALIDASAKDAQTKADQALQDVGISTNLAQTAKDLADVAKINAQTAKDDASQAIIDAGDALSQAQTLGGQFSTLSLTVDDLNAEVDLRLTRAEVDSLVDGKGLANFTYVDNQIDATAENFGVEMTRVEGKIPLSVQEENLVLKGDEYYFNTSYKIARYDLSKELVVGKTYTIVLKGGIGTDGVTQKFSLYTDNSGNLVGDLQHLPGGIYRLTFTLVQVGPNSGDKKHIDIYNSPNNTTSARIDWLKIVEGSVTDNNFTPSRADLITQYGFSVFETDFNVKAEGWDVTSSYVDSNKTKINSLISNADGWQNTITYVDDNKTKINQTISRVDSYQQTIGENGEKIAQLVMTDSLFSTKVLDTVEIGGRNYAVGTTDKMQYNQQILEWSGNMQANTSKNVYTLADLGAKVGDTYTASIYIGQSGGFGSGLRIDTQSVASKYVTPKTMHDFATVTFTVEEGDTEYRFFYANTSGFNALYKIEACKFQIEKGNKRTDWNPSPLDKADQSQVAQLAGSWALTLKSGNDIKTQINASTDAIRLQSKFIHLNGSSLIDNATIKSAHIDTLNANKIVGNTADFNTIRTGVLTANAVTSTHIKVEDALIDELFATEALIDRLTSKTAFINSIKAIEISADKVTGGTLTGTTFITTESVTGFSTHIYNGAIEFKHQIFTLGHIHATVSSTTGAINGFAVVQRPGYIFSINSRSNLPNNGTSTAVLQVPADSTSESRKLNIFARGGFRIRSDTLDIYDDSVVAKKPLRALDGFMASHEQSNEGAKIADAGNLIYSVDKAGSVMIHRFMVRRKDGTWPNNGLAIYEDGRVAVVVNGVWKQL